jgi:hypothetical protein
MRALPGGSRLHVLPKIVTQAVTELAQPQRPVGSAPRVIVKGQHESVSDACAALECALLGAEYFLNRLGLHDID